MNLFTKQEQTYRLMVTGQGKKDEEKGELRNLGLYKLYIQFVYIQLGLYVHIATFKMDNQQGPNVQHREICSMLHGSLDGRGVSGRVDTYICMYG